MVAAWITFALVASGAVLGMFFRVKLPVWHFGSDSKEAIRLVMGLITTMVALVLGLLVASAKSSYDAQRVEIVNLSAEVIQLDRVLAHYGPEAAEPRSQLRITLRSFIDRVWPSNRGTTIAPEPQREHDESTNFFTAISQLSPATSAQRFAQSRALDVATAISRRQAMMVAQSGSAIPLPFLVVMVFWLVVLFTGYGLFATTDATTVASLLIGALSVASAVSLILQLDRPYEGWMQVSGEPLRSALAELGP